MKYKTLFRLALKLVGVVLVLTSASGLLTTAWMMIYMYTQQQQFGTAVTYMWVSYGGSFIPSVVGLLVGLYFFFGGEWIVNMAIPSNRPYCHECGYDLTGATGHVCNECGTPFKPAEELTRS